MYIESERVREREIGRERETERQRQRDRERERCVYLFPKQCLHLRASYNNYAWFSALPVPTCLDLPGLA